ncbi:GNAT family N-acetyltransferase [Cyclobacterium sp. 1_MG-2023]|uniref:GNAT family N-acetyltransferase n=1 Tax=Cyclobacterium sp. 1_MG-2023 TaxID=3062681 RepID=UPI0026E47A9E|nr:GNAT family N-acetyltransferase [Cyclobacterium sp. 1_MG-2023]MDO6436825.1 GNAT family N-acetyltransferase [Cyclobacterium sp. 1_MG-2023]
MFNQKFIIKPAGEEHCQYAETITGEMERSAQARGTGIAKRSPEYIKTKMREGKAVIALTKTGEWAGFCYIEAWGHGKFVANSGLIVSPNYRKFGLAREIKKEVFRLSRKKYPDSKIFGLTTGAAVMKINSDLGYYPVSYSDLTTDEEFWKGCQSCVNYPILMSKNRSNCLCTAMLYEPKNVKKAEQKKRSSEFKKNLSLFERLINIKRAMFLNFAKGKKALEKVKDKVNQ